MDDFKGANSVLMAGVDSALLLYGVHDSRQIFKSKYVYLFLNFIAFMF